MYARGEVEANEILEAARKSGNLVRKLKQRIATLTMSHYEGGYTSGRKLNPNRLILAHRKMQHLPSAGKVFARRKEGIELDTALYLLLDCSASMNLPKFRHAAAATLMLWQAAVRVGIPVRIDGFSTYLEDTIDRVLHIEVVNFNEIMADGQCAARLAVCSSRRRNNNDAQSIAICYGNLLKVQEKRKILVVLSDGAPMDGNGPAIQPMTKKIIEDIERNKAVELYGIGIADDSVKYYYTRHVVFNRIDELEQNLITFIQNVLLKP